MGSFSDHYKQGDCERVWMELVALGDGSLVDPVKVDAEDVAAETMRRVRRNVEVLIPRLRSVGYQFGAGFLDGFDEEEREIVRQTCPVFAPPVPDAPARISELEAQAGMLPLSLRAFFVEVGTVNLAGGFPEGVLAGAHPHTGGRGEPVELIPFDSQLPRGLDPLFVYSLSMTLDMWQDWRDRLVKRGQPTQPYMLPIGPDYDYKYGTSGGGVYSIETPSPTADAPLRLEWHHTTFVNYLRICFRWGGLPGLECAANPPLELLAYLTEGLLPI